MPFDGRGHYLRREVCPIHGKTHLYKRSTLRTRGNVKERVRICDCGAERLLTRELT